MGIISELFFDFEKEYSKLNIEDVKSFGETKNYLSDIENFKKEVEIIHVQKDGKDDYISLKKDGVVLLNFRGDLIPNLDEVAKSHIYNEYKKELKDYIFNKLLGDS